MGLEPFIIIMEELKPIGLMLDKREKYRRRRETNKWLHRVLLQLRRALLLFCRVLLLFCRVLSDSTECFCSSICLCRVEMRQAGCAVQSVGRTNVWT
jgi:hypothetical protein